jgi:hypothetical protein
MSKAELVMVAFLCSIIAWVFYVVLHMRSEPKPLPPNQIKSEQPTPPYPNIDAQKLYKEFMKAHPDYPKGRPPEGYPGEATLVLYGLLKKVPPLPKETPETLTVMPRERK